MERGETPDSIPENPPLKFGMPNGSPIDDEDILNYCCMIGEISFKNIGKNVSLYPQEGYICVEGYTRPEKVISHMQKKGYAHLE